MPIAIGLGVSIPKLMDMALFGGNKVPENALFSDDAMVNEYFTDDAMANPFVTQD